MTTETTEIFAGITPSEEVVMTAPKASSRLRYPCHCKGLPRARPLYINRCEDGLL